MKGRFAESCRGGGWRGLGARQLESSDKFEAGLRGTGEPEGGNPKL
jgi:hypothetical protein